MMAATLLAELPVCMTPIKDYLFSGSGEPFAAWIASAALNGLNVIKFTKCIFPIMALREQRIVHNALSQIGFVGVSPMDFIYRAGETTCAIPVEETRTFDQAVSFLREGAFQNTLAKATRLLYYRLADLLAQCPRKGTDEQRDSQKRLG
jgi:hypothetical protein